MIPFPPSHRRDAADRRIEQSAADWLALHDRGLSCAEQEEFTRWLEADQRHARVFAQLRETWSLLDEAGASRAAAAFDPEIDSLQPRRHRRWVPLTIAAAAALAIVLFSWWRPARETLVFAATTSTTQGIIETVELPDGSTITVNSDSAVDVHYSQAERRVRLWRGEAHFLVARDPARPFVVLAHDVAVRAVGTSFNVKLQERAVEILVTEGKVRIDADSIAAATGIPAPPPAPRAPAGLVTAGQQAIIALESPDSARGALYSVIVDSVSPAQIGRTLAWRQQKLDVVAAPLSEIVAEFNRFNRVKVVIADPDLAARNFGGSFKTDDPETLVRLLETTFGVVAHRHGEEITLRAAR